MPAASIQGRSAATSTSARITPDTLAALSAIATDADPVRVLEGYNPQHAGYIALRSEPARIRAEEHQELVIVPPPTLRLGDEDERVAMLRVRLDLPIPGVEAANIYDEDLMSAVREFQANVGLVTDGIVGPNTLGALNGPSVNPEAEIIANMERWPNPVSRTRSSTSSSTRSGMYLPQ